MFVPRDDHELLEQGEICYEIIVQSSLTFFPNSYNARLKVI